METAEVNRYWRALGPAKNIGCPFLPGIKDSEMQTFVITVNPNLWNT